MLFKKTLAFYIRLSSEDEDLYKAGKLESNSVTNQRELLLEHLKSCPDLKEYELIEFCDDGFSGTNFERPRFMEMMQLVKQRQIHAIMVKDLSRFGRDYLEVGAYLELVLPLFGTRFISVNDGFDSNDYIGTTGGVELALRNLINGLYSKDLSLKIRSANRTRNRRGEYWGGAAFYGYKVDPKDKHKLIIDDNVSDVVVRIFNECIEGRSASQIAKALNDDGIMSPAKYKKSKGALYNGRIVDEDSIWTATTVIRILKDERYTGKMISHKREAAGVNTKKMQALPPEDWIVVLNTHEPIISQEKFDEAKAAKASRIKTVNKNTAGNRADNLFVCGHCGRKLQKSYGTITHLYCLKAGVSTDSACTDVHEPLDQLQRYVLKVVNMMARILVERVVSVKISIDQEIPTIERKIAEAKRQLRNLQTGKVDLYEDYRQGRITREKFIGTQKKRQQESDWINASLIKLEKELETLMKKSEQMKAMSIDAKEAALLPEYRPAVIRRLIKSVRVYGKGRIEIDMLANDNFILEVLAEAVEKAG